MNYLDLPDLGRIEVSRSSVNIPPRRLSYFQNSYDLTLEIDETDLSYKGLSILNQLLRHKQISWDTAIYHADDTGDYTIYQVQLIDTCITYDEISANRYTLKFIFSRVVEMTIDKEDSLCEEFGVWYPVVGDDESEPYKGFRCSVCGKFIYPDEWESYALQCPQCKVSMWRISDKVIKEDS